ncbi:MAG: hypothetical protein V8R80_09925 [Eubacterium sp.]
MAINIAIVLDEYGSTAGLITVEDLLKKLSERSGMNTITMRRIPSRRFLKMSIW